jgi:hypothetical protein
MEPIRPPQTLKFYQLLRMATKSGLNISNCGTIPAGGTNYVGTGMYTTLQEAEHNRTLEVLKDQDGTYNSYHIFELELPNPVYKE